MQKMFDAFSTFDYAVLSFFHDIVVSTGGSLNGIVRLVSMLGEHGLPLILISLVLTLFKKTRRVGVTMIVAIAFGALFTNVVLKNVVQRVRPFNSTETFKQWWIAAGKTEESEWSFPSGHATCAMAFGLSYFLTCKKTYSWLGFVLALVIGATRLYLCVHYPSDVLFGFIDGALGAVISYYLVKWIYVLMFRYPNNKLFKFYFNFSVVDFFRKKEKTEKAE